MSGRTRDYLLFAEILEEELEDEYLEESEEEASEDIRDCPVCGKDDTDVKHRISCGCQEEAP